MSQRDGLEALTKTKTSGLSRESKK